MSLYAVIADSDFSILPYLRFGWDGPWYFLEFGWLNVGVGAEW